MSIRKQILGAAVTAMCIGQAHAANDLYSVFSIGYSEPEFMEAQADDVTYKFAMGYQIDRQWYVEGGYQQLADVSFATSAPLNAGELENFDPGMQGDALYIALLGKAANKQGELFYKVGVMNADIKGQSVSALGEQCSVGTVSLVSDTYQVCEYDEGSFGGILGIGFDFYVASRMMLRVEAEYIKGQDDLEVTMYSVGLRYNF